MKNWKKNKDNRYINLFEKLYDVYGPQKWWPADTPFEVVIGAILVQNTSWKNVERSIKRLKPYLSHPKKLAQLPEETLAQLIRSSGFYRVKAKRISAFLRWFQQYDYEFDRVKKDGEKLRNELLEINGIGNETADVILLYVFHVPVFIADRYARTIFQRFGIHVPPTYEEFRKQVEFHFPKDAILLNEFHALLVTHGKTYCKKKPICEKCPIQNICQRRFTS
ncbi:endonuclease III domain-containing protein [Fervidibacillus halotolerans]|uniref:Endonuclease III domain-containing protein n=1 Tax=Fervidibacillus halotolerans TaxID=2980027 RepID=A0A9E8M0W7_9BACI|nr:endonuclease III domain-containing protein [Fervidibacillus halotolerans]WAA13174.1 endonuclease III domain-containing protein [Fervidibacillus halotolerans]